ncbi:hypothetical protein VSS74_07820 [Conexibacter stalactiti]|uniref:Uncharacterized protein n=1 Tax=Conexibacter stalactiti TaxID=1940611 RepID=A0ABU4HLQ5_9ACTN|nr:hypothetical protein [Conexibacter stalactiti]MDW5594238.1 hypothetical protein [Conexibacter stalactiti]MEC5034880.1 hypothetical protein [Conexibacter stalactiti]
MKSTDTIADEGFAEFLDAPLSFSPLRPLPPLPPGSARRPVEVFPTWSEAQRVAARHAAGPLPAIASLRSVGFLPLARAERIMEWYIDPPASDAHALEGAYSALAEELIALDRAVTAAPAAGGLGVRVTLVATPEEPYADAADLCDDVRQRGAIKLRAAAADAPHPLLPNAAVDRLRTVHDVLGHAALGLGFDLQSEYAAWLYCRPLFSRAARPAAFCELVGRVTAHVLTGTKPAFRADLPPAGL